MASFPIPGYDPRPAAAAIPSPVAVLVLHDDGCENAYAALAKLENSLFTPGTPANDLFQVVHDWGWEGVSIAIAVFPGEHLPLLGESVRASGLHLLDGSPETAEGGKRSRYDVNARLEKTLGIRACAVRTISARPEFFAPISVHTV